MVLKFGKSYMRTYLILKEKGRQFAEDNMIQTFLQELNSGKSTFADGYSPDVAKILKDRDFDVPKLTNRSLPYEKLDQLVTELLLG